MLNSASCRSRDTRAGPQQGPPASTTPDLDPGFSFTKLLGLEDEGERPVGVLPPPPLGAWQQPSEPPPPPWRRLVAPPGTDIQPAAPEKVLLPPPKALFPYFKMDVSECFCCDSVTHGVDLEVA